MHFIWQILLITVVVRIGSGNDEVVRQKRAQFENFNVLLNLYKMNPLKKSNIYKSFSNRVLLPNRDAALNLDYNESLFNTTKPTLTVKQLENIINTSNSNNTYTEPDFDIENIVAESFTMTKKETLKESLDRKDFHSIFGLLESVKDDQIPVTKKHVNTNSVNALNSNEDLPEPKVNNNVNEAFGTKMVANQDSYPQEDKRNDEDLSVVILRK